MMWQDIVIALVGLGFGFMMFPQIKDSLHGRTVNMWSAGLTMLGLVVLGITFATLELWLSMISEFFSGATWFILFVLSYRQRRTESESKPMAVIIEPEE